MRPEQPVQRVASAEASTEQRPATEPHVASSREGDRRREPWVSITACPNGPLLVRGDVEFLTADGSAIPRRRGTVALCRCGASGLKPFCDGSHKVVGFRTEDERA